MSRLTIRLTFAAIGCAPCVLFAADRARDIVKHTLQPLIDSQATPSAIVAVVSPDSTRYFSFGHLSFSNRSAPTPTTLYEIGSISKVFTGTLLADMIARNEVRAADPVRTCLPSWVKHPTRNGKEITLEHLATHTSGLLRIPLLLMLRSDDDPYADQDESHLYSIVGGMSLFSDPGQTNCYSNLGFALLGNALARKASTDYESLLIHRICDPLHLSDTRITLTSEQEQRFAPGHSGGRPVPHWHLAAYCLPADRSY